MRTLIEIGEQWRIEFLPACYEEQRHWLRRRSWKRAVLAWVLMAALAVALGLWAGIR